MISGIAKILIEGDLSATRFEHFCTELAARLFGYSLVVTSTNYDRARDARTLTSRSSIDGRIHYQVILHATLRADLEKKTETDLKKMSEYAVARHIIYCSSQPLTESQIDKLSQAIRQLCPEAESTTVMGSFQLSQNAEDRYSDVFSRFYVGEIATIEQRLSPTKNQDETVEQKGLRLALIAFGNADSAQLRDSLLKRLVLELLVSKGEHTEAAMLRQISKDLGLQGDLQPGMLSEAMKALNNEGLVHGASKLSITELGRKSMDDVQVVAARDLLEGRSIIKESLENLTGIKIEDKHFQKMWNVLLDFLSELFYTNGYQVIKAINAVFKGKAANNGESCVSLESLLTRGAASIASMYTDKQTSEMMRQAVLDMFNEHTGPAFEWLAAICERFVAICALGLETTSSEELKGVLRRYRIVLDSDILLTLLCQGEPENKAANSLVNAWRRVGGSVFVAAPVLEEAAHHAWISDIDFKQTEHLLGRLNEIEKLRYLKNAFVRTYHLFETTAKRWPLYISSYKGQSPEDYSKILRILRSNYGVEVLPQSNDVETKKQMTQYFLDMFAAAKDIASNLLDGVDVGKAERDGQLLASITEARVRLGKIGSDEVMVLISSSPKMRKADAKFRKTLGDPEAVLSLSAATYLLSLVPDVGFGLATLRTALFEFGDNAKLADEQRIALRIIKGQDEYDVPWAARGMLQQQLSDAISREASRRGVSQHEIRNRFSQPSPGDETPAQLILESVRAMALESSTQTALSEANKTIVRLKDEVYDLKQEVKKVSKGNH